MSIHLYGALIGRLLPFIVAGAIAAYVLLSQLANQDLVGTLRQADWRWALAALAHDTMIYSGHEYTAANARFALSVDGNNPALLARVESIAALRERIQGAAVQAPWIPALQKGFTSESRRWLIVNCSS